MKGDVKCRVACLGRWDNDNMECPNLDIPHLYVQKGPARQYTRGDTDSRYTQRDSRYSTPTVIAGTPSVSVFLVMRFSIQR